MRSEYAELAFQRICVEMGAAPVDSVVVIIALVMIMIIMMKYLISANL